MKARKVIEGSTYGPAVLTVIGKAFDDAWAQIKDHVDGNMLQVEEARLKLAHAVLAVAREDSADADELKNLALQVLALNYKQLAASDPAARRLQ